MYTCGVEEFDATPVLKLMETLLSIAHEDRHKCLESAPSQQHELATSSQLEHLICSLQSRLLAWCQQQLTASDVSHRDDESVLVVQAVIVRCTMLVLLLHVFTKFL